METTSTQTKALAILVRKDEGEWKSLSTPGVSVKVLHLEKETQAVSFLLKLEAGARFPAHNHPAGEEVFVIEGDLKLGGHHLRTGDYLYTPPDGKHAAWSQNGCLVFVNLPKPIEILKDEK
ncbi:MAG: cupin domain-containing protein [Acidobacteriota bacterium]